MGMERDSVSLKAYLDAIFATERFEPAPDGRHRCVIPALAGWQAEGVNDVAASRAAGEQVNMWIARHLVRQKPLPAYQGISPQFEDVSAQEVVTERLRLIPYSLRKVAAAAALDHAALAAMLGARVHPEWGFAGDDADDDTPETVSWWLTMFNAVVACSDIAPWKWLIAHAADNVVIGEIGTFNPPGPEEGEDSIQFGYSLVSAYHNHGYMTEAARAYISWAFAQPRVSWIYAMTESDNIASQRVLEKLGARRFFTDDSIPEWIDWELLPEYCGSTRPASD